MSAHYTITTAEVSITINPGPRAGEIARALAKTLCIETCATNASVTVYSSERGTVPFAVYHAEQETIVVVRAGKP